MLPASPLLAVVLWSFLSSKVVALPVPAKEYDPFIHGLPGWKPWFGIGPVVRPILEHQAELKTLEDAKNKSVNDDDVAQGDPPKESVPTTGIKGWNSLFGKGPVMFHRRPLWSAHRWHLLKVNLLKPSQKNRTLTQSCPTVWVHNKKARLNDATPTVH